MIDLKSNSEDVHGVTLIELLLAMVITLIIIGALITAFISHNQISAKEEAKMEVQQNLRMAVDRVSHVLRHAGFGCYDSFANSLGNMNAMPHDEDNSKSIESFIYEANPDEIAIVYGFKKIANISRIDKTKYENSSECEFRSHPTDLCDIPCSKKEIKIVNINTPQITKENVYTRFVSFFPDTKPNTVYYFDDPGNTLELDQEKSFISCSDVYMVSPARIYVQGNELFNKVLAYDHIDEDDKNKEQYWVIAEDIEDIQFQYSLDGETWRNQISDQDDLQNIRNIKFTVFGEKGIKGETVRIQSSGEVAVRNVP